MEYDDQLHANHIVLKVDQGTTRGGRTLCVRCRSAHVIRGINNEHKIFCSRMPERDPEVKFDIAECNLFLDKSQPSLTDMEEVAWRVLTEKSGKRIGFVDPSEFRRIHKENNKKGE